MAEIKDYYNTGDDSDAFYIPDHLLDRKICETFTTTSKYSASSVKLKIKRTGTVGDISVAIKATSGGKPTGPDLAVCTYDGDTLSTSSAWVEFTFDESVILSSGVKYAIVLAAPNIASGGRVIWRYDGDEATYEGGETGVANDGSTWTVPGRAGRVDDAMFELWGASLVVSTQVCTDTIAEKSTGHGTIEDFGDTAVTQHGHCWSTSHYPTTADTATLNGAAPNLGQFESAITGLTPGTTYYVRAYATDSDGTSYGDEVTIPTDASIGRRYWWTEGEEFHWWSEWGDEMFITGTKVGDAE